MHFTARGDVSANSQAATVLSQIRSIDPDPHFALGDLSYGATGAEQSWCDLVTSRVGAGSPFELLSSNHESDGLNGNINDVSACLPNQLPGVVGTYGRQYDVDVPEVNPVVWYVMISPALTYRDGLWSYGAGSARYQWTAAAIDGARAAGVPWVVVGMHEPCLSVGQYSCEPGSALMNLLVSKKVDLVSSGHEHLYARSTQLAHGPSCSPITPVVYSAECVRDGDNSLVKGAGIVFAIAGTGGTPLRDVNQGDTYAIGLTVFDDAGKTATSTRSVTTPGQPLTLAADTSSRTVPNGFGTAEVGGPWTLTGTSSRYSVSGSGRVVFPVAAVSNSSYLAGRMQAVGTDPTALRAKVWKSGGAEP